MTGILLGCPLWSEKWIDRFLAYCLPSMREPENHDALMDGKIVIYTDADGMTRLQDVPGLELREIPLVLMTGNRWDILATVQMNLLMQAASLGMGVAAMQPDIAYAAGFFANLKRLAREHEAIISMNLWADASTALPVLDAWRTPEGDIAISAAELGELGWRYLHPLWRQFLMNGVTDLDHAMPSSHLLSWQGRDAIHIRCPHLNALWLSPRLCRDAAPTNSLDAVLPQLIPADVEPYVARPEDGLTLLEFADVDEKSHSYPAGPFSLFAQRMRICANDLRFFKCDVRVPIYPRSDGMTDSEIGAQFDAIVNRLEAA